MYCTRLADTGDLRKGADGYHQKDWQGETCILCRDPFTIGRPGAFEFVGCADPFADPGTDSPRGCDPLTKDTGRFLGLGDDCVESFVGSLREGNDLTDLLINEGEPGAEIRVKFGVVLGFEGGIIEHVLGRVRRCDT